MRIALRAVYSRGSSGEAWVTSDGRQRIASMPPRRGESIERNDEHDEFIKKLTDYHVKRGYV